MHFGDYVLALLLLLGLPECLKAVLLKIVGPVFFCFGPEIDPWTPVDGRGPPGTSLCNKNQHRKPSLKLFRCEREIPPDCLQVPNLLRLVLDLLLVLAVLQLQRLPELKAVLLKIVGPVVSGFKP